MTPSITKCANYEVEIGIIGALIDNSTNAQELLKIAEDKCLRPEHFEDPMARAAYDAILKSGVKDNAMLAGVVRAAIGPEHAQSFMEEAVRKASGTAFAFNQHVDTIGMQGRCRIGCGLFAQARSKLNEMAVAPPPEIHDMIVLSIRELRDFAKDTDHAMMGKSEGSMLLKDLPIPTDEELAAVTLIGDGWMRKGHAAMLVSVSGAGKSVMAMQLAYAWAHGMPAFGIPPTRPLKIAIFQTEDDRMELGRFKKSMRIGAKQHWGWSDSDIEEAESNVSLEPWRGKTGEDFVRMLRDRLEDEIADGKPPFDLVILNPLHSFVGGNISDNTTVTDFLRNTNCGLDSVIKDKMIACGLLAIHHTAKPPMMDNRKTSTFNSQFAEYVGFGASELPNYMRAVLVLSPRKQPGEFALLAAKRHQKLNWEWDAELSNSLPAKLVCHSPKDSGIDFWLEGKNAAVPAPKPQNAADTPQNDPAETLAAYLRESKLSLSEARDRARNRFGRADGDKAFNSIKANPAKYGLKIEKDPDNHRISHVFGAK